MLPMDDFLRLWLYTLKKAKPGKRNCENISLWRYRLKREVVEVQRVMVFSSTLLHHFSQNCEQKLSSTYHVSDLFLNVGRQYYWLRM